MSLRTRFLIEYIIIKVKIDGFSVQFHILDNYIRLYIVPRLQQMDQILTNGCDVVEELDLDCSASLELILQNKISMQK